jgi:predicted nucleic acid-binding protein
MNLLLDTNVLIDFTGRRAPFYEDAQRVIAAGYFGDVRLWMAAQSAADIFYVLSKHVSSTDVQRALAKLYEVVKPVGLTSAELMRATQLLWPDYKDCLIALAADNCRASYIITRDANGFARSSVPAISPSGFMALMEERGIFYDAIDL